MLSSEWLEILRRTRCEAISPSTALSGAVSGFCIILEAVAFTWSHTHSPNDDPCVSFSLPLHRMDTGCRTGRLRFKGQYDRLENSYSSSTL